MATYLITSPDGRKFRVTGEGTKEDALAYIQSQNQAPTSQPDPPRGDLYDHSDDTSRAMLRGGRTLARGIGRAMTGLADGIGAIPRMFTNAPIDLANAAGANIPRSEPLGATPELAPQNSQERFETKATNALGGVLSGVGLGQSLAQAAPKTAQQLIGSQLASQPAVQTASALTGTMGQHAAEESGAGPLAQIAAGLGASLMPGTIANGSKMLVRGGFRGGEEGRKKVEQNLDTFSRAGTTPTVGQATESRAMRGIESVLSRTPGASGRMIDKATDQADDLSQSIEQRAASLAKKTSGEQAGRAIEKGISGSGGFTERFRAQQEALYDKLDEFLPGDKRLDVGATRKALADLNAEIPGAPEISRFFQNSKIAGIKNALDSDATTARDTLSQVADGKLPYEAVKKLRTLVGKEIADSTIASDVPRSKWTALYAALSDDLGNAVKGDAKAQAAWTRANDYTRAGMKRLEAIESVINRNGGPEKIFQAATANTKEGATTLRAVMQSLDGEGQKTVTATVLRRLGIANPSNQSDLGEAFSTETFLTNWNKLSGEAKRTLFDRYGSGFRSDMDQVAKVASNLREGSKVFRNPSGTAQAAVQQGTVGAFVLSVLTGNLGPAAAIAAAAGGGNITARLMTNPGFVRWLAQSTKHPLVHAPSMLNRLAQQAQKTGDPDLATAVELLQRGQTPDDQE